jgi:ABC-2 type transport system permease protein
MQKIIQRYRYSAILLKQLVITDFKVRYQGSWLGYVWTLLRPLALFVILYLVFAKFLGVGDTIPYFPVYLLLGIVFWNYFVEVTMGGVASIVGSGDLIRKINFPKYVIILAGSFSALINLTINMLVIAGFMYFTDVPVRYDIVLLPFVIAQLFVFSLALAFLLSALYVKARDISYIWEVVLQAGFYATPILYPIGLVLSQSEAAGKFLMLNPMAQMIQDARFVTVTEQTQTISGIYGNQLIRLIPYGITLGIMIIASYYFRKRSKYFAEEV